MSKRINISKRIDIGKRIDIVLPETTIHSLEKVTKPGQRSSFIDQAVRHFAANRNAAAVRTQLERAAIRDQDLDREVAADWFAVDQETWQQLKKLEAGKRHSTQGAEKSSLPRSIRR